jgi:hypothetical protein
MLEFDFVMAWEDARSRSVELLMLAPSRTNAVHLRELSRSFFIPTRLRKNLTSTIFDGLEDKNARQSELALPRT